MMPTGAIDLFSILMSDCIFAAREDVRQYIGRCAHLQRPIWRGPGHRRMELSAAVDIVAGGSCHRCGKLCRDKAE